MRICSECGGNCYDGELVGGICHECRTAGKRERLEEKMRELLCSPSEQMSFIFDGTDSGTAGRAYKGRSGWN